MAKSKNNFWNQLSQDRDKSKTESFLSSQTDGIANDKAFFKSKFFGLKKINESSSEELFQWAAHSYLASLV